MHLVEQHMSKRTDPRYGAIDDDRFTRGVKEAFERGQRESVWLVTLMK